MKKGRFLKGFLIVGLVAVAVVSVLAFTYRSNRQNKALPVATHTVSVTALTETVSGTGTLVPDVSSMAYSRVSGVAEKILVKTGDRVNEGDPLVELDLSDFQRAVRQAESTLSSSERSVLQSLTSLRAAYRNAQTAADQAKRNHEKNLELFKISALSEETLKQTADALESAGVNLRSAREQLNLRLGLSPDAEPSPAGAEDDRIIANAPEVSQAKIALESARINLARARITAPVSGTVTQIVPSRGDIVAPSAPVAKIESLDTMNAEVQIDEVDIGKITEGSIAEITSDSLLGTTLTGTVAEIAPVISQVGNTRVSRVEISVDAGGRTLKAGASCTARITTRSKENVLAIPLTGFVTRENTSFAYVLAGAGTAAGDAGTDETAGSGPTATGSAETGSDAVSGTAEVAGIRKNAGKAAEPAVYALEEREIETGISTVNLIEVVSGLSAGDVIAVGNLDILRNGMNVTTELPGRGNR